METLVYGIDINHFEDLGIALNDFTDEMWIEESERQGLVWSLDGFQRDFNAELVDSGSLYIRFISK